MYIPSAIWRGGKFDFQRSNLPDAYKLVDQSNFAVGIFMFAYGYDIATMEDFGLLASLTSKMTNDQRMRDEYMWEEGWLWAQANQKNL